LLDVAKANQFLSLKWTSKRALNAKNRIRHPEISGRLS